MFPVDLPRTEPRPAPGPRTERHPSIGELAETRLRSNSYLALKNVSCEFTGGRLTLRGCLPTYYLKQIAQELVADVVGVKEIVNQINVIKADSASWRRN